MGKFNAKPTMKTVNREGHAAYAMHAKEKLVTQVMTSFINEKKFYGDNTAEMAETLKAVIKSDPDFVSRLAVFARREFNMRSVSHLIACYLANVPEGKPYIRHTVEGIVLRGDDATEIMACYLSTFGKPIPNGLRRALRDAIAGFDAYTLAKYKGTNDAVKMRDLFRICRPVPKDEAQSALWKSLMDGTIATPYNGESELSAKGNNAQTWHDLIASGKVGYMAMLRNLRNIEQANPDNIDDVLAKIRDPEAVRRSRQLPFRFLSAYRSVSSSKMLDALEDAADASIANMPRIPGRTVIAVDTSGSMGQSVSGNSDVRCCEIGMMLGLLASRICDDAIFYTFDWKLSEPKISARSGVLYAAMHEAKANGGTDMSLPIEQIRRKMIKADRIIYISDNECNSRGGTIQSLADIYRNEVNPDLWVHTIDLMGYGTQQFAGPKTNIIAGWSEKVLEFILMAEQGEGTLEKRIAAYEWEAKA